MRAQNLSLLLLTSDFSTDRQAFKGLELRSSQACTSNKSRLYEGFDWSA